MLLCERYELLFIGLGGNARDEHCAIGQDRLGHFHTGHSRHDIEVIEEFIERMTHAGSAVRAVRSAGRRRDDELLALEPARPFEELLTGPCGLELCQTTRKAAVFSSPPAGTTNFRAADFTAKSAALLFS